MKTISAEALEAMMREEHVVLIDVRTSFEHRSEHIPNDHSIPLSTLTSSRLPEGTTYVLYCLSGTRSQHALDRLSQEDPHRRMYSLAGGITAWKQAGFATTQALSTPQNHASPVIFCALGSLLGWGLGYAGYAPAYFLVPLLNLYLLIDTMQKRMHGGPHLNRN